MTTATNPGPENTERMLGAKGIPIMPPPGAHGACLLDFVKTKLLTTQQQHLESQRRKVGIWVLGFESGLTRGIARNDCLMSLQKLGFQRRYPDLEHG